MKKIIEWIFAKNFARNYEKKIQPLRSDSSGSYQLDVFIKESSEIHPADVSASHWAVVWHTSNCHVIL